MMPPSASAPSEDNPKDQGPDLEELLYGLGTDALMQLKDLIDAKLSEEAEETPEEEESEEEDDGDEDAPPSPFKKMKGKLSMSDDDGN